MSSLLVCPPSLTPWYFWLITILGLKSCNKLTGHYLGVMKRAACRWPVEKCSLLVLSKLYCLHFSLYNGSWKMPSTSTTALFSVDINQTVVFYWSMSTRLQFSTCSSLMLSTSIFTALFITPSFCFGTNLWAEIILLQFWIWRKKSDGIVEIENRDLNCCKLFDRVLREIHKQTDRYTNTQTDR